MIKSVLFTDTLLFLGGLGAMTALYFNKEVILNILIKDLKITFLNHNIQLLIFCILLLILAGSYITRLIQHFF